MTPHLVDQGIDDRVSRAWLMPLDGDTHTPRPAVLDYSLPRLRLESQPLQGCRTGANQCPDGPARRSRHHARRSPAGKPRPRLLRAWTFPKRWDRHGRPRPACREQRTSRGLCVHVSSRGLGGQDRLALSGAQGASFGHGRETAQGPDCGPRVSRRPAVVAVQLTGTMAPKMSWSRPPPLPQLSPLYGASLRASGTVCGKAGPAPRSTRHCSTSKPSSYPSASSSRGSAPPTTCRLSVQVAYANKDPI